MKRVITLFCCLYATCVMAQIERAHVQEGSLSQESSISKEQKFQAPKKTIDTEIFASFGVGHILNKANEDGYTDKELYDKLRNGFDWNIGFRRYYDELGWRLLFQHYYSTCDDNRLSVPIDQNLSMFYLAPHFTMSSNRSKKWIRHLEIGLGWLMYKEGSSANQISIKGTGHTVGSNLSAGIEYKFSSVMGIGLDASILGGVFNKLKYNDDLAQEMYDTYVEDKEFGASRLQIALSIHFHL